MTNELEKTFFNTFGIEPKCVKRTLKLAMPEYNENDLPKDLMQFMSSQTQVYHIYFSKTRKRTIGKESLSQ